MSRQLFWTAFWKRKYTREFRMCVCLFDSLCWWSYHIVWSCHLKLVSQFQSLLEQCTTVAADHHLSLSSVLIWEDCWKMKSSLSKPTWTCPGRHETDIWEVHHGLLFAGSNDLGDLTCYFNAVLNFPYDNIQLIIVYCIKSFFVAGIDLWSWLQFPML